MTWEKPPSEFKRKIISIFQKILLSIWVCINYMDIHISPYWLYQYLYGTGRSTNDATLPSTICLKSQTHSSCSKLPPSVVSTLPRIICKSTTVRSLTFGRCAVKLMKKCKISFTFLKEFSLFVIILKQNLSKPVILIIPIFIW